jgi:hypothetical protein
VAPFGSIKPRILGIPRFLGIQSLPAGLPGTRKVGFIRVGRRDDLRVQYNTRIAEADRIAEFKEVAVFLRRLENAAQ